MSDLNFTKPATITSSIPAAESELAIHQQPVIVAISEKAQKVTSNAGLNLKGLTTTGGGLLSQIQSAVQSGGIQELATQVTETADKINSTVARATSPGADPLAAASAIGGALGFEIPSIPSDISGLLSKFSTPPVTGDGSVDLASTPKDDPTAFVSDAVAQVTDFTSSITDSISSITDSISSVTDSISSIASIGGLPTDNVITSSLNNITSPIQSSLSKVTNITDGTSGIIT